MLGSLRDSDPISRDKATCRGKRANDQVLIYVFVECVLEQHLSHQKDTLIHFIVWAIPGNQEARRTSPAPSVVVVVVLGHEDVVLLQHRREVLADLGPNVQEGHHDHGDADETEGSLVCCPADDTPAPPKKIK